MGTAGSAGQSSVTVGQFGMCLNESARECHRGSATVKTPFHKLRVIEYRRKGQNLVQLAKGFDQQKTVTRASANTKVPQHYFP